jgi:hypothetical protein
VTTVVRERLVVASAPSVLVHTDADTSPGPAVFLEGVRPRSAPFGTGLGPCTEPRPVPHRARPAHFCRAPDGEGDSARSPPGPVVRPESTCRVGGPGAPVLCNWRMGGPINLTSGRLPPHARHVRSLGARFRSLDRATPPRLIPIDGYDSCDSRTARSNAADSCRGYESSPGTRSGTAGRHPPRPHTRRWVQMGLYSSEWGVRGS